MVGLGGLKMNLKLWGLTPSAWLSLAARLVIFPLRNALHLRLPGSAIPGSQKLSSGNPYHIYSSPSLLRRNP